jgi:hypothetical protein
VLGLLIPPLAIVVRLARSERVAVVVLSAIVAHSAWHWMVARGAELAQFQFAWPHVDAAFAASLTTWLLLLAIAGGVLWLLRLVMSWVGRRWSTSPR